MEISKLSGRVTFEALSIGSVVIAFRTAGFLQWFDRRRSKVRGGGPDFVRRLLIERATLSNVPETRPDPSLVSGMSDEEIEASAQAALEALGSAMAVPSGETAPGGAEASAAPSAKLLGAVEVYAAWHSERRAESAKVLRDQYENLHLGTSLLKRGDPLRMRSVIDAAFPGGILSQSLAKSPIDIFEKERSLIDKALGLNIGGGLFGTDFSTRADTLLGKAARAAPGSPLDDLVGRSIAAATHSLLDYDQAINSIGTAASLSALRGNLGIGALARTAPVDPIMEQARRASALFDAYPTLRIAKDANALFGLGLSKSVLSAIAGGRAFSSLSPLDAMTIDRMARPGFGVLASLGLGTNGVQGAISDLLSRYGDDDRAPLFGAVAAVPEALDTSEGVEAVVAAIEAAWQRISVQLAITPKTDRITITGLMTFAGLLLALWSAVVAQYSYEASKDSPSKAQIESLRGDISGAGANGAERDRDHNRHIRYLDRVAPLRVEPDGRALVLRVVYPDQLLRVQDTRGAWAFVEVYDYKSDQPITGWISRTRLRRRPY